MSKPSINLVVIDPDSVTYEWVESVWLEFRPLTRGFSILAKNADGPTRRLRVARSFQPLQWRAACQALLQISDRWGLAESMEPYVHIYGLKGWQASLLTSCFLFADIQYGREVEFLCIQPEEALTILDANFEGGLTGDECLSAVSGVIESYGKTANIFSVCGGRSVSTEILLSRLAAEESRVKAREECAAQRKKEYLASFDERLDQMVAAAAKTWSQPHSFNTGMYFLHRKGQFKDRLRNFVLSQERLPRAIELEEIEKDFRR